MYISHHLKRFLPSTKTPRRPLKVPSSPPSLLLEFIAWDRTGPECRVSDSRFLPMPPPVRAPLRPFEKNKASVAGKGRNRAMRHRNSPAPHLQVRVYAPITRCGTVDFWCTNRGAHTVGQNKVRFGPRARPTASCQRSSSRRAMGCKSCVYPRRFCFR